MTNKTILICGATGFIGRNLVEHFAKDNNNKITALFHVRPPFDTPENVSWIQGDLRDAQFVEQVVPGHDVIIQAAATTSGSKDIVNSPHIHVTDNALMNSLLLRASYDHHVSQFVFFSCTVMYPSSSVPVSEAGFTGDISEKYFGVGWTKVYIERMCEFFASLGRTRHTVIRHSNIYGPWDKFDLERSHVFGASLTKIMTAEDEITVWGTGEEKRDLLHVSDLIDLVKRTIKLQTTPYSLLNCGAGKAISVKAMVEMMVQLSGKNVAVRHDLSKPTIPFDLVLDTGRAKRQFDWQPQIQLHDGIAATMRWWQENIDPETLTPLNTACSTLTSE